MTWDISGKNVLVTGGTSGIGRATAAQLARRGAHVTMTSRRLTAATSAAEALSAETGTAVTPAELDLTSLATVRAFATSYLDEHDRLGVLVNNAGIMAASRVTTDDGSGRTRRPSGS